jgi:hypothetical protein
MSRSGGRRVSRVSMDGQSVDAVIVMHGGPGAKGPALGARP